ncbi:uncharacterized protein UDID_18825 [Ustilago sp. UG-2017a]|nr:uncharacterized protein UDID_18825 [Ustilago sp. UG-2017a]
MVQETEAQAVASKATNESDTEAIDDNTNEEIDSDSDHDNDGKQYNFRTLAKLLEPVPKLTSHNYYSWSAHIKSFLRCVPHAMKHLDGAYDKKHPKWNHMFDDALTNALHSTIDTTGEFNINYLILDIIREHHTFHNVWKKIENGLTNEATAISRRIALIAQLGELRMYNSDVRKLIQEIRTIQMESSLLGKPFADDTLFSNLQKCTIRHPMYKETVATVSQLSFSALTTALSIRQSAIENNPAPRVDPRQASARVAGSDDQNETPGDDEKDEKDADSTSAKEIWCSLTHSWPSTLDSKETSHWILDSGASYHMVNDYSMLIGPRTCQKCVLTAGSEVLEATAIGDASISTNTGDVLLQNVLYVQRLNVNLLSTNSLTDEGARVILDSTGGQIYLANGMLLKMTKNRERGLLEFRGDTWQENTMITSASLFEGVDEDFERIENKVKISEQQLWHEHLGHLGRDKTRAIINHLKGDHPANLNPNAALTCEHCIRAKSTAARMGQGGGERSTSPLDLIHIDLIVDSSHATEYTCTLVLIDDHSKYVYVRPLLQKSHAFKELKSIIVYLETQAGKSLKAIRSDQGTEWRSNDAHEWAHDKGIEWQMTVGYDSRQNGRRRLPKRFWPHAIRAAAFKMNLTLSIDDEVPYQAMFGRSPERLMKLLRVFGCLSWVNIPKAKRDNKKLDQRAVASIFLGYSLERRGWLFYSPDYRPNIFWSNSAKFMETKCWSDRTEWRPVTTQPPPALTNEEDFGDLRYTDENLFDEREEEALQEYMDMDNVDEIDGGQTSDKVAKEAIKHNTIADGWNDNKHYGFMATNDNERKNLDPTISEALSGEDKKHWEEAMHKELDGLKAMGTWEVADLPKGMNTVDTRWVLKIKTDANLIPTKFKARLVARGFTQREGIDYTEVFAPVAPIQSIRGVLAMAAVRDWEVDCVDVKQAYLNSTLHHSIFLKPPLGMKVPPGKALKLMKGLYGLKQSGREWNMELDSHLRKIGFYCMPSAPCLYSRGTGDSMTIITAYVDDMLITSPSCTEVSHTKDEIMAKWGTEDKGPVKEFLGVRIDRDRIRRRMTLDLTAYIKAMVRKWLQTTDLKSWVPMQSLTGVTGGDKCNSLAAKQYQELVGQLLWISNTARPDISFTVGTLARYMSSPMSNAWKAALHLVKYLNQTSEYKLLFGDEANKHSGQQIVTYTDANWASDPTNGRRSTSGGVTYVYGCPVSWRSHVQKCVALSAVEAEFVAASEAAREALFFSYLLRDLGVEAHPPTLQTDSQGCIQVSKDPAKHWKLKHIDTRYHFVRDHVQEGEVKIDFVGTTDNVADILTKLLKGLAMSRIARLMGLTMPLRGRVEDVSAS